MPDSVDPNAGLLEAISAGIEEGSSLPVAETHVDADPIIEDGDGTVGDGTVVEPETTEVEAEAAVDDKGVALRDEKGRFLKKQPEAETPEAKTAREAAEALANKGKTPEQIAAEKKTKDDLAAAKKDPVNAPIPKDLKVETRERMQALVKVAKEATAAVTAANADRDFLMKGITDAKCSPEQYGQSLTIISLINSGDRAKQEQALTLLHNEYATLAKILGKPVAGVDMLADHADLKAEVQGGKLTQERAQEIAALRESTKIRGSMQQQQNDTQTQTAAAAKELSDAKAALNVLEGTLKTDPQYLAKKAFLTKTLADTFKTLPPKQWAATFERAFKALPKDFGKPAATVPGGNQGVKKGTPLRATNGAGGQVAAPASMLEAVNAGINAAAGR